MEKQKSSFFDGLYDRFFKQSWSYVAGAVILAVLNFALLASSGKPWGVMSIFYNWGAWLFDMFGATPENWDHFQNAKNLASFKKGVFGNAASVRNIGIIVGALLATLLAGQFKIKTIKSFRQFSAAALGGLCMGYGAKIAFGCNIGAFFSGTASMSLHGWVYMVFIFLGAIVGSKLLVKVFMK